MKALRLLPLLALLVVGCNGGGNQQPAESDKPGAKPFKVALLTPGPVSDAGWSAMAYDGLMAIKSDLGAEVNNQEAKGTQIKDAMRQYAQDGYDLIIGHGFEYNEPGVALAKDFPNTVFVSSSGGGMAANAGAFRFYLEQGFYLCGMMAGYMSKTGTAAMIGGDNVASIKSTFKGFRAGFMAARPNGKVIEVFTGNGQDVAAAKQATLNAIGQGADFVIHQANAAAQGVFDACKEKGAYAFGANQDQNSNPSGVVIASATIIAKPAFLDLAKRVKDHTYKGEVSLMGMDKGAIDFVINPVLKDKVPADVQEKLADAEADIKSGKLVVPKDEF
ncbi:MAG TPA: BMP family protein [Fimbriimonadaceae bacterium]|nr:BMP family protein [Fimbriimonadaceae bacterium]